MTKSFISLSNAIRGMVIFGLLAILLVIVQSCSQPKTGLDQFAKDSLKKLTVLQSPPAQPPLPYLLPDKTKMTLSDYKGKVILLNVWATWCAPCIAEMPTLDALQAKRGGADFEVVTVSLDRTAEEAAKFLRDNGLDNLQGWHDGSYSTSSNLLLPGLPTSVFYDRRGREVARVSGEAEWTSPEALALIDKLTVP